MTVEYALALMSFAFVTSLSPGPSNFMLLASGANFGFRRTIPQILGITIGFTSLLLAVGLGLGALLSALPMLHLGLKITGGAYLLYLAWRIGMARSMGGGGNAPARPLSFTESALFQWINPKAWVVALTAMSVYSLPGSPYRSVLILCACFALVNLPSVSLWAGFGVSLRGFLSHPVRLKYFNIAMALLLVATLWPMVR